MAFGDTGRKQKFSVGSVVSSSGLVHTGSVAGNLLTVVSCTVRAGTNASDPTITDSGGNTWTKEATNWITGTGIAVGISWTIVAAGKDGDLTITCSPNGVNTFTFTYYSHEFTGPHASPKSGSNVTNTGTGTSVDTTAQTPADNDPLCIAAFCASGSSTIPDTGSAPGDTDWTLSNESETGVNAAESSFFYKIESGAPGTPRAVWDPLGTSRTWCTLIMAFKPSGVSAVSPSVNEALTVAESVTLTMNLQNMAANDAVTVADALTMHMPIAVRMYKP